MKRKEFPYRSNMSLAMQSTISKHIYKRNNMPSMTSYYDIDIPKMQVHSSNLNVMLITQRFNPPLNTKQALHNAHHASYTSRINFIVLILILYTTSVVFPSIPDPLQATPLNST